VSPPPTREPRPGPGSMVGCMFEGLSDRFEGIFKRLRGRGRNSPARGVDAGALVRSGRLAPGQQCRSSRNVGNDDVFVFRVGS